MAGRPTKYTDEKAAAICKDIERGNPFSVSTRLNGVPLSTFNDWRDRYPQFADAIHVAEAKAQSLMVNALVTNAVAGDTKAAIFYLTHRHGDEWKPPKETREITGKDGGPIGVKTFDPIANEV